MRTRVEADREYWSRTLTAGGVTTVPRWAAEPAPGTAWHGTPVPGTDEHEIPVPDDLTAALRALAAHRDLPVGTLLLAAHLKVLAVLSGEPEVVTGHSTGRSAEPLPCRTSVPAGSWHTLLTAARSAETEVLTHQDFPVEKLRRELGLTEPPYEIVSGPLEADADHADAGALHVRWTDRDGRLTLRLRHRTDVLDTAAAARLGGYHLTALRLMTADPDADHTRQSLLSAEERLEQLDTMAGPHRTLPDARAHELFEQRVRAHPQAVAAVHGQEEWTYDELNRRANRLARALLARGLGREGVVAVVTERTLDWPAAMLAVFKAGGVYLPIEPHFPAGRIAATLSRAGCRLHRRDARRGPLPAPHRGPHVGS
ncbi:AMP-binding protein, partial [Streptomyces sp. NPDC007162]|uniref:AMP-binding protein n=1 Tax=Streptomyces sp. NPDC007162 TaxID=3156917 RepID=UPI003403B0BF